MPDRGNVLRQSRAAPYLASPFAWGVEIRSARRQQAELRRQNGKARAVLRSMTPGHDFDRLAAKFLEFGQQAFEFAGLEIIASGMGKNRLSATLPYPTDGILQTGPAMLYVARPALDHDNV